MLFIVNQKDTKTAIPAKTSLKKWPNLQHNYPDSPTFSSVGEISWIWIFKKVSKFLKRRSNLSSYVHVVNKRDITRGNFIL